MKIAWAEEAEDEVAEIVLYIANDNPAASLNWYAKIKKAVLQIQNFPYAGRETPEFADVEMREVLVGSYRVMYNIRESGVYIYKVIHGARLLGEQDEAE